MSGTMNLGGKVIENLGEGSNPNDAVTYAQLATKLNKSGGTMTGWIDMGGNKIENVATSINLTDAVTRAELNTKFNITGGAMTGHLDMGNNNITNVNLVNNIDLSNMKTSLDAINTKTYHLSYSAPNNDPLLTMSGDIKAESFVKNGAVASEFLMGDGSVLAGSDVSIKSNFYRFTISTDTAANPDPGQIVFNNATQGLATEIKINRMTSDNLNIRFIFDMLSTLNEIYVRASASGVDYIKYGVSGEPYVMTSYVIIPVVMRTSGGAGNSNFADGADVLIAFFADLKEANTRLAALEAGGVGGGGGGGVSGDYLPLTGGTLTGDLTATGFKVANSSGFLMADGGVNSATYVPLTGGTLTGDLTMGGFNIINAADVTASGVLTGGSLVLGGSPASLLLANGSAWVPDYVSADTVNTQISTGLAGKLDTTGGTLTGDLTATGFKVANSSGFLMADGSVNTATYVPLTGGTLTGDLTATTFVKSGGLATEYLMANGSSLQYSANSGNSNFYLFTSSTSGSATPAAGQITYNNANQSTASIIYISSTTSDAINIEIFYKQLSQLNEVYIQDKANSANYIQYNITATPTITTNSNVAIPVAVRLSGGTGATAFADNTSVLLSLFTNAIEADTRISALENTYLKKDGTVAMTGVLTATGFKTAAGTSSQFLMANGSVNSTSYLALAGGTMTGALNMGSQTISNAGAITSAGQIEGTSFKITNGTASQFLKGNGVPDTSTYIQAQTRLIQQGGLKFARTSAAATVGNVAGTFDLLTSTFAGSNIFYANEITDGSTYVFKAIGRITVPASSGCAVGFAIGSSISQLDISNTAAVNGLFEAESHWTFRTTGSNAIWSSTYRIMVSGSTHIHGGGGSGGGLNTTINNTAAVTFVIPSGISANITAYVVTCVKL